MTSDHMIITDPRAEFTALLSICSKNELRMFGWVIKDGKCGTVDRDGSFVECVPEEKDVAAVSHEVAKWLWYTHNAVIRRYPNGQWWATCGKLFRLSCDDNEAAAMTATVEELERRSVEQKST